MTDISGSEDPTCETSSYTQDRNSLKSTNESISIPQPLYITIGPPCSGKTTWIQKQNENNTNTESTIPEILDICIDDQPGVYLPVPIEYFLPPQTTTTLHHENDNKNDINQTKRQQFMSNIVYGRSVQSRIDDSHELRAVIRLLSNIITKEVFDESVYAPVVVKVIEDIVKEFESKQQPLLLPNMVDLFIVDAIFRRPPPPTISFESAATNRTINDNMISFSALERIEQLLYDTPISTPIALGNTNTKPTDYVKALQMAHQLQRPVQFVVYCDDENIIRKNQIDNIFDLTVKDGSGGIHGLIRRNIYRFLQTGRYIQEQVIYDMRDRTHTMINDIMMIQHTAVVANKNSEMNNSSSSSSRNMTKLEFHQHLSRFAGFIMNDDRIITSTIDRTRDQYTMKRNRPISSYGQAPPPHQQRPWDRPASAVRGYNGQLENLNNRTQNGRLGK